MFSAKTTTMSKIVVECGDPNLRIFKHRKDGRTQDSLSSHDPAIAGKLAAIPIRSLHEIAEHVDAELTSWVFVDEIQFFDRDDAASALARMCAYAKGERNLVVAGLDHDFRAREFETTKLFIERAEYRICLSSTCARCGRPAELSYLLAADNEMRVINEAPIGGADQYEPRCVACHPSWKENTSC